MSVFSFKGGKYAPGKIKMNKLIAIYSNNNEYLRNEAHFFYDISGRQSGNILEHLKTLLSFCTKGVSITI